jgi:hypothetical protein
MWIAEMGMWTPGVIVDSFFLAAFVLLILFGITSIVVGGYYFIRVAVSSLLSRPFAASQKRSAAARQSGHLALLAVACGPLISLFIGLISIPALLREPGYGFLAVMKDLLLVTGLGTLAGIIAGGAFWASSALLDRTRKTVKKWAGGRLWDSEFDGLA